MKRVYSFALVLIAVSAYGRAPDSAAAWAGFLGNPTSKSEAEILEQLRQNGCRNVPNDRNLALLTEQVGRAGILLIRPAIATLQCLDGGPLEDMYRSLGQSLSLSPSTFLETIRREKLSAQQLTYIATMLPLSLSDDMDSKIAELGLRQAGILKTEYASGQHAQIILHAIEEAMNRLRDIKNQPR